MARQTDAPHRLPAAALTLAIAVGLIAAALTGCTPASNVSGKTSASATPSGVVTGTASAGADTLGKSTGPVSGATTSPPTYPGDYQAYAQAVVDAWVGGRTERLGQLASRDVTVNLAKIVGHPATSWRYDQCLNDANERICSFRNNDGDELRLRVASALLGKPHAAVQVVFEPTRYPADAAQYVDAFLTAWNSLNNQRMLALANSRTLDDRLGRIRYTPGHWYLDQNVLGPSDVTGRAYVHAHQDSGLELTFVVIVASLGKPHAIECIPATDLHC